MECTGAQKIAAIRPECPGNEETAALLFTRASFLLRGGSGDVTGKTDVRGGLERLRGAA